MHEMIVIVRGGAPIERFPLQQFGDTLEDAWPHVWVWTVNKWGAPLCLDDEIIVEEQHVRRRYAIIDRDDVLAHKEAGIPVHDTAPAPIALALRQIEQTKPTSAISGGMG